MLRDIEGGEWGILLDSQGRGFTLKWPSNSLAKTELKSTRTKLEVGPPQKGISEQLVSSLIREKRFFPAVFMKYFQAWRNQALQIWSDLKGVSYCVFLTQAITITGSWNWFPGLSKRRRVIQWSAKASSDTEYMKLHTCSHMAAYTCAYIHTLFNSCRTEWREQHMKRDSVLAIYIQTDEITQEKYIQSSSFSVILNPLL